jgi:hypothetical protein
MRLALHNVASSSPPRPWFEEGASKVSQKAAAGRPQPGFPRSAMAGRTFPGPSSDPGLAASPDSGLAASGPAAAGEPDPQ